MSTIELIGCPAQPLASYLKALAVLRLVSEQADTETRAHWSPVCFVLNSALDREGLLDFLLNRYHPTPVVAPWNGGSGFYPKDRKVGINAIEGSTDSRFEEYRTTIATCRVILTTAGAVKGASKSEEDDRRAAIVRSCRNQLPDAAVDWLDAAIAIASDGERAFAPILGTGGNEGRLDYTNNFMENVAGLLLGQNRAKARELLEHALFETPTDSLQDIAVGQYDPGRAGGFNQGQGIAAASAANPWNAVLTIEGATAWAGGVYRKQGVSFRSLLCSPFTVRPAAVGYGSAAGKDAALARAEIWTPLWKNPARYAEIRALLREGRATVDGKIARNGLEFAQAAASLGVDRGISGFVRYSLLKRRGDSYICLPAGRFSVDYRPDSDLIREIPALIDVAERAAKGSQKEAPNSWPALRRAVEEAMFNALLRGGAGVVRDVAAALGAMHRWLLERGSDVLFSTGLSAHWIERCAECADRAPEVRIAAALAAMRHPDAGPLAHNLTAGDSQYSWTGRDLPDRMMNTLRRRVLSGRESVRSPLRSAICASPEDVSRFLDGAVDDRLIEDLVFAFVLVKTPALAWPERPGAPWPVYCLLKQMFLPGPVKTPDGETVRITPDLAVPALLSAGRIEEAAGIAQRRLRVAGFQPVPAPYAGGLDARRLAASLLILVSHTQVLLDSIVEKAAAFAEA